MLVEAMQREGHPLPTPARYQPALTWCDGRSADGAGAAPKMLTPTTSQPHRPTTRPPNRHDRLRRTGDAVSICVPTPLNKTGDLDVSYIASAGEQIARYLHPGRVIVLESTTYPGTTREMLLTHFAGNAQGLAGG